MQYGRVRTGSVESAQDDGCGPTGPSPRQGTGVQNNNWGDGSDNENMPAGNMHVNAHDRISLEQWHKQRVRKLSIAGCLFLGALVILLVVARTQGESTALMESEAAAAAFTKVTVADSGGTPFKCGFQDAAYYIRRGSNTNRWLVYLGSSTEGNNVYAAGGGICDDVDACKSLAAERPETHTHFEGILSNSDSNPFRSWQVVYVPWCSGFAFATSLNYELETKPTLVAQGPEMLSKIMSNLPGAQNAEVLVLAGSGTGGMQALMRANVLKQETQARKVMVIADSAFAVNNKTSDMFHEAYSFSQSHQSQSGTVTSNLNGACTSSTSPVDNTASPWQCMWPNEFLKHTYTKSSEVPVFIAQSLYDTWALKNLVEGGNSCFNPTTFAPTGDCPEGSAALGLAHAYKRHIREQLEYRFHLKDPSTKEETDPLASLGMWIIGCPAHGLLCHDDTYLNPELSGKHWIVQHKELDRAITAWVEDNLKEGGPTDNHVFIDGKTNDWSSDLECPTRGSVATRR